MDFDSLKASYKDCRKCEALCSTRTQVVFGSGSKDADVLFVGEAPGANEDKKGIPFCGMSGKILDELLATIGLNREDIFITNTILCRPPKNRNPKKDEVENSRERLDQLLEVMKPKVIVTIGNFATDRIIGKTGVKTIRGKVFEYDGFKVVPVVHPASFLYSGRNPEEWERMKNDFQSIASVVEGSRKQKTLGEF